VAHNMNQLHASIAVGHQYRNPGLRAATIRASHRQHP